MCLRFKKIKQKYEFLYTKVRIIYYLMGHILWWQSKL